MVDEHTPSDNGQPGAPRKNRRRRRGRGKGAQPEVAAAAAQPQRQPARPSARPGPRPGGPNAGPSPGRGRPAAQRGGARPTGRPRGGRPAGPPVASVPMDSGTAAQIDGLRSTPKGQLPKDFVYGINPVAIALDHGQLKVLYYDATRQTERLQHLHALASDAAVEIRPLQRQGWARILPSELHQGVAGLLHEPARLYIEEVVQQAKEDSCILVLDRVQDPQNLGAVLRTAAATGVDAVVLPKAGGCPVTPAVHKASAGMSIVVPIVEDENLARALDYLKEHGYWVIGCDSEAGEDATTFEFPKRRVIVMGNEAEGMRRLIKESCDYNVRIPMAPGVESLNISVASAVVLYLAKADLARAQFEEAEANGNGNGEAGGELEA